MTVLGAAKWTWQTRAHRTKRCADHDIVVLRVRYQSPQIRICSFLQVCCAAGPLCLERRKVFFVVVVFVGWELEILVS